MATFSGTVYREGSTERIAGATVKAISSSKQVIQDISDDDGDFSLANLNPGKWSIVALHIDSFPSRPVEMDIMSDVTNFEIRLHRLAGEHDQKAGQTFFNWLLGVLGGVVVLYIVLHLIFPLRVAGSPLSFVQWSQDPWRFLEIILWSLGGILVNKIILSGLYLRNQRFYREGIIMHVAHLVTAPLLVLVTVLLLSLATLSITLTGGSEVTIDLKNLPILMAVSFLLGTSPWPLWNFIERSAKGLIGGQAEK